MRAPKTDAGCVVYYVVVYCTAHLGSNNIVSIKYLENWLESAWSARWAGFALLRQSHSFHPARQEQLSADEVFERKLNVI